jgi:CheY-like chemotaxis protein
VSEVGLRVLVADDNHDTADTLCVLLRLHGHLCRAAYNGEEALDVARDFRPHVALLDLLMPHDGFAAARQLRRLGPVVLVAVTGDPDFEKRALCGEVGFHFFLRKPADPEEVLKILGAVRAGLGDPELSDGHPPAP